MVVNITIGLQPLFMLVFDESDITESFVYMYFYFR